MQTVKYDLKNHVPPSSATGVTFVSLERQLRDHSPLALVWYTTADNPSERASRIDLHKEVFLDDFGNIDPAKFAHEAGMVASFLSALETRSTSSL